MAGDLLRSGSKVGEDFIDIKPEVTVVMIEDETQDLHGKGRIISIDIEALKDLRIAGQDLVPVEVSLLQDIFVSVTWLSPGDTKLPGTGWKQCRPGESRNGRRSVLARQPQSTQT